MKKGIALLFALLLCTFFVSATTYYVDDSAVGSNDGTSWANAWINLSFADDQAGPDSLILVADGIYLEDSTEKAGYWYPNRNSQNRTFMAVNKSKATIGAYASSASRVIRVEQRTNNLTFVGFTITGNNSRSIINGIAGAGWAKFINNTFINGTSAFVPSSTSNWYLEGNTINTSTAGFNGIGYGGDNVTIINNTFSGSLDSGAVIIDRPSTGPQNIIIRNNHFYNSSGTAYGPIFFRSLNASGWILKDNIFGTPDIPQEDMSIQLRNVTDLEINNNTFWAGNFTAGYGSIYVSIGQNNSNLKIYNNKWGNSTNYLSLPYPGRIIYLRNASGSIVENNSMYLHNGTGIDMPGSDNGQTEDIIIRNNTLISDICFSGYGIKVGADDIAGASGHINNTIIENNSISIPKTPCSSHLLFTGKTHNSRVRNNMVRGGGYGILSKHDTIYYAYNNIMANQTNFYSWVSRSGHNSSFHNNTIYCNPYNDTANPTCIQFKNDNSPERNVTNVTIYNNIIYMYNKSDAYRATEYGTNFSNINITSWNNTFYIEDSSRIDFGYDGTNNYQYLNFTESFGLEDGSIYSATNEIPAIYSPTNTTATTSAMDIAWYTQESCNSTISYGTLPTTLSTNEVSSRYNMTHKIYLTGLSGGTVYYYNISSCDFDGNCNISETFNFTTLAGDSGSGSSGSSSDNIYYEPDAEPEGNNLVWTRIKATDKIRFDHKNQQHEINIRSIHNEKVKVKISSEPQDAWLEYGVWRKVDVDQNGGMDVLIKVEKIYSNEISVYLEKLSSSYSPAEPTEETSEEEVVEETADEEEIQEKLKTMNWAIIAPLLILALIILATSIFLLLKKKKKVKHTTKKHHKKRKHKKK